MKKIAIRFGDNDFYNTFTGVLKVIMEGVQWNGCMPHTKEQWCALINELSPPCYVMFQNGFEYNGLQYDNDLKSSEEYQHVKDYLQVTPDRILLDTEVDEYVKSRDWDNSETFILDMTVQPTPYIYAL